MSEIIKNFIDTMDHGEVMVTCGSGDSSRLLNINGKVSVRSVDDTLVFTDPSGNTVTISK